MNREAAIAPYSSLCYRFCTSFEPKPQEIVMALFTKEESLAYHEEPRPGKLEVLPVKPCFTQKDLSMAYSPGVANACLAIADDPSLANAYTGRGNLVAVVSNGTAVLGLGNIGRAVVPLAKAFGCSVAACDGFWPEGFAAENGVERMDVAALFAECDVVSLHCPLNGSTRNLVDYNLLSTMKPHALLINAARSGVVVEADLARILAEGWIRGAALDCFADDGRAENPFLSIPAERVLLTPHLAGVTRAAFGRMLSQALENLERVLVHGLPPRFVVNGVLADYSD